MVEKHATPRFSRFKHSVLSRSLRAKFSAFSNIFLFFAFSIAAFFITIAISSIFSAIAQDSLEQRFNAVMRKVKLELHIKSLKRSLEALKESMLAQKKQLSATDRALIKALVDNPDFEQFITRPAHVVSFSDQFNPMVTNKKEQLLYDCFGLCAAYRNFIKDGSFFRRYSGSVDNVQAYTKSMVQAMHERGKQNALNTVVLEVERGDCYYLAQTISAVQATVHAPQWHVTMHNQGGHHILSITAYSPNHAPLIFIIDTHNGGAYAATGEYAVINAHFNLQNMGATTEPSTVSDYNCYIYTFGLTKAAIQYLQQHDLTDLKQACESADYNRATAILHGGMQQYLPYYERVNGQYVRKSRVEIDTYNRNLRWQLSGQILLSELKKLAHNQTAIV